MTAKDVEQWKAASVALNDLASKELRKDVYATFREIAQPFGKKVLKDGAAGLPRKGGLAANVAAAKVSQSNSTTGRNPGVAISFKTKPPHDLKTIDDGIVRHPVFKRGVMPLRWKAQKVPRHLFTNRFVAGQPMVAKQLIATLDKAAQQVAHQVDRAR